jgi:serine/threonine protein kinase
VEYCGQEYALKWFFPGSLKRPQEFLKNLKQNIQDGAPAPSFLWPLCVTEETEGSFGYLMKLRPKNYCSFTDILNAKQRIVKHSVRVNAALNIVESFMALHRQGKSYQDLNDGNFFINPEDGSVLICDNDNVAPYGVNLGIAGKMPLHGSGGRSWRAARNAVGLLLSCRHAISPFVSFASA